MSTEQSSETLSTSPNAVLNEPATAVSIAKKLTTHDYRRNFIKVVSDAHDTYILSQRKNIINNVFGLDGIICTGIKINYNTYDELIVYIKTKIIMSIGSGINYTYIPINPCIHKKNLNTKTCRIISEYLSESLDGFKLSVISVDDSIIESSIRLSWEI